MKYFQNFCALENAQAEVSKQSNSRVDESLELTKKLEEKIKSHP